MVFAYLGPDTLLPLTSVLAAVLGGLLMFGRNVGLYAWAGIRWVAAKVGLRRGEPDAAAAQLPEGLRRDEKTGRFVRPAGAKRQGQAAEGAGEAGPSKRSS